MISENWRILVGIGAIPGVPLVLSRFFVPESPRYCMVTGQMDRTQKVINAISRVNEHSPPSGRLVFHLQHKKPDFVQTFLGLFGKDIVLTTLLLWVIWFCLSYGSWGFSFIIPIVFDKIHGTRDKSYIYRDTLIVILVSLICYLLILLIINRVGRRWLMGTTFMISGVLTGLIACSQNPTYVFIMAALVNFFSTAPWSVIYTYTPEVYPTTLRTTGVGACAVFTRLAGTITPLCGETLLGAGFYYPFISYGIAMVIAGLGSFLLPVETLNRALQDEMTPDIMKSAKQLAQTRDAQRETMTPLISRAAAAEDTIEEFA